MAYDFKHRAIVDTITGYQQGSAVPHIPGVIPYKLSSNENPYEPLESVKKVLEENAIPQINRYPEMRCTDICRRIAELNNVSLDNVVAGSGSTGVIVQLVSVVAGAGDEIIYPWRSFEAYPIIIAASGATGVPVPLASDGRHDIDAMIAAINSRTRLVVVNNPNNPTGAPVTRGEVSRLMDAVPADVLVLFDEAYFQFNTDPERSIARDIFDEYPNVVIAQTFSKAYGLAGLRIGYGIAQPEIVSAMLKVALPFGVSDLAQKAALASLDALDELQNRVDAIVAERKRVMGALRGQGWLSVPESQANYFWLPLGSRTAEAAARFRAQSLAVRAFDGEGIRVSIGVPEANDAVIEVCAGLSADGFVR